MTVETSASTGPILAQWHPVPAVKDGEPKCRMECGVPLGSIRLPEREGGYLFVVIYRRGYYRRKQGGPLL